QSAARSPTRLDPPALHAALPIYFGDGRNPSEQDRRRKRVGVAEQVQPELFGKKISRTRRQHEPVPLCQAGAEERDGKGAPQHQQDRKSTRLNSSHVKSSYAVFCL